MDTCPQVEYIQRRIFLIRGHRVMLDADLARLYGVSTRQLNQQVRRNSKRFPQDFMFTLAPEEFKRLMSQIVTSKKGRGGRRKLPMVFTQEGVAMLSGVLHSERAVEVNIAIMRAFVKLREMLSLRRELARRLAQLERRIQGHDAQIHNIFDAIRELMRPAKEAPRRIGFTPS